MSRESSDVFYTPEKLSSQEVENSFSEEQILKSKLEANAKNGFDEESFHEIIVSLLKLGDLSEYKQHQMPIQETF